MSPREEQQFTALLEQVRSDVKLVAEGLAMLDQKVDRGFRDLRREMAAGHADLRAAIAHVDRRFTTHAHGH